MKLKQVRTVAKIQLLVLNGELKVTLDVFSYQVGITESTKDVRTSSHQQKNSSSWFLPPGGSYRSQGLALSYARQNVSQGHSGFSSYRNGVHGDPRFQKPHRPQHSSFFAQQWISVSLIRTFLYFWQLIYRSTWFALTGFESSFRPRPDKMRMCLYPH